MKKSRLSWLTQHIYLSDYLRVRVRIIVRVRVDAADFSVVIFFFIIHIIFSTRFFLKIIFFPY